jgi:hypothetical protein
MSSDHIHFFFNLRNQIKLHHWQTRIYARHVATDSIVEKLDKNIDAFVEVYIGKYSRPKLTGKNASITLHNMTESGMSRLINSAIRYLQGPLTKSLQPSDTDLFNIRDEMIADLHQLMYLFTLH